MFTVYLVTNRGRLVKQSWKKEVSSFKEAFAISEAVNEAYPEGGGLYPYEMVEGKYSGNLYWNEELPSLLEEAGFMRCSPCKLEYLGNYYRDDIEKETPDLGLYDETVKLVRKLGHYVALDLEELPKNWQQHYKDYWEKAEMNDYSPAAVCSHTDSYSLIYLAGNKNLLWHEVWHIFQRWGGCKYTLGNPDYLCPKLLEKHYTIAASKFFHRYCTYSLEKLDIEFPALAVENDPKYVVSILRSFF